MWSADFQDFSGHRDSYSSHPGSKRNETSKESSSTCVKIRDLQTGVCSGKIIGVVIAKEESRQFTSKKDPSQERFLLNFTFRDSPTDFINVTCWGGKQYIEDLSSQFSIGDVVQLEKACVQAKPVDGSDEKFRPWTPSMLMVNMSENRSVVSRYAGWNCHTYESLVHIPVKASDDFYTIADVNNNANSITGDYVNLLCAVRKVGDVRECNGKGDKILKRVEVQLFDQTSKMFALVLWDIEQINLAQAWLPKETVIFATDVRVKFDDYRKTMVATATSKTIFVINPDTREASRLYQYAQAADVSVDDKTSFQRMDNQQIDLGSITAVNTVDNILTSQKRNCGGTEYCIVYAYITQFNIDGDVSIVIAKCAKCKHRLDHVTRTCVNIDCPIGSRFDVDADQTEAELQYDCRMSLSDHTGTVTSCVITGDVLHKLIGCSVEDYLSLDEHQLTSLKWAFLFEQCKFYLKMLNLWFASSTSSNISDYFTKLRLSKEFHPNRWL